MKMKMKMKMKGKILRVVVKEVEDVLYLHD